MQNFDKLFSSYDGLREEMANRLLDEIEKRGLTSLIRQKLGIPTTLEIPTAPAAKPKRKNKPKEKHAKPQRHVRPGSCSVSGCKRERKAKGFCKTHWDRDRKGKPLGGPLPLTKAQAAAQGSIMDQNVGEEID